MTRENWLDLLIGMPLIVGSFLSLTPLGFSSGRRCSGASPDLSGPFRRQPQDHVAVALAGTAQEAQPIDHVRREPDQALGEDFRQRPIEERRAAL